MRNLEAKFRLANLAQAQQCAVAAGFVRIATLVQRDTFFAVPHGKLKLREEADGASLIHYQRGTADGFDLSNYTIAPQPDPAATRALLAAALGVIAEVRKRRTLLRRDHIRLHLDEVERLGTFGEIEIVLAESAAAAHAPAAMRTLLATLAIPPAALLTMSYFEMLTANRD